MFAYSAFPKKKSNQSSGGRQAKNNSPAKTAATFEPGVYTHLPSTSELVLAVKWREAGESPHLHWEPRGQNGAWAYLCLWGGRGRAHGRHRLSLSFCLRCSSLHTTAALDPNGVGREQYLLGLPVTPATGCGKRSLILNCWFPAHAELLVWSHPVLMSNLRRHRHIQGGNSVWRLGGVRLSSSHTTRLFIPGPELVMVFERWGLMFWS